MKAKPLIDPVLLALAVLLRSRGYIKSGSTFRLRTLDTIFIISLQSSDSSTSTLAKVTVNLGVHVPALQDPQRPEKNPSASSVHWHERIGRLMPEKRDIWWSIHSAEEAASVAPIITRCVEQFGIPALAEVSTVQALKRLWESGCSPGLTEVQRVRHLQALSQVVAP
jgi:hypothetical protein